MGFVLRFLAIFKLLCFCVSVVHAATVAGILEVVFTLQQGNKLTDVRLKSVRASENDRSIEVLNPDKNCHILTCVTCQGPLLQSRPLAEKHYTCG